MLFRSEGHAEPLRVAFYPGRKPWEVPGDAAIPCATQNELTVDDAVLILANGVRYYVEGANMPATAEALRLLRLSPRVLTAGAKAAGSGGVPRQSLMNLRKRAFQKGSSQKRVLSTLNLIDIETLMMS